MNFLDGRQIFGLAASAFVLAFNTGCTNRGGFEIKQTKTLQANDKNNRVKGDDRQAVRGTTREANRAAGQTYRQGAPVVIGEFPVGSGETLNQPPPAIPITFEVVDPAAEGAKTESESPEVTPQPTSPPIPSPTTATTTTAGKTRRGPVLRGGRPSVPPTTIAPSASMTTTPPATTAAPAKATEESIFHEVVLQRPQEASQYFKAIRAFQHVDGNLSLQVLLSGRELMEYSNTAEALPSSQRSGPFQELNLQRLQMGQPAIEVIGLAKNSAVIEPSYLDTSADSLGKKQVVISQTSACLKNCEFLIIVVELYRTNGDSSQSPTLLVDAAFYFQRGDRAVNPAGATGAEFGIDEFLAPISHSYHLKATSLFNGNDFQDSDFGLMVYEELKTEEISRRQKLSRK